jgi:hypothetical protein
MVFDGKVGGVGKSIQAAAYGELLVAKGLPFAVVEADVNNNIADYLKEVSVTTWRVNLMLKEGWIELLNILDEEKTPDVILSLPAGADTAFAEHARMLTSAVTELKRTMTFVWSLNRSPESVMLFKKVLNAFSDSPITFVVARNLFFGSTEKFKHWNNSEIRKSFLSSDGNEIDFPELDDELVAATFGALPKRRFSASGEAGLRYGERLELRRWLDKASTSFETIAKQIGMGKW